MSDTPPLRQSLQQSIKARDALRDEVSRLVEEFEQSTGLMVTSIEVERLNWSTTDGRKSNFSGVDVHISLPPTAE